MRPFLKAIISLFLICVFNNSLYAAQFTIIPRVTATVEYTDNLFLSSDNEQEDTITEVSAGFTAGVTGRKAGIEVSYDPSYVFYQEFNENDRWRHSASLNAFIDFARQTQLTVYDYFLYTEDPLPESEITALRTRDEAGIFDTTVRTGRDPYWRNTARARIDHQFGPNDTMYAEFTHGILENEDPTIEDSEYITPAAGVTYWFTQKWGFEIVGNFTQSKFDQNEDFVGIPSDDFDRWNGYAQLSHRFTPTLQGYIRYTHTDMDFKQDREDYRIYDGSIGIFHEIVENISLTLEGGYFIKDNRESEDEDGWRGLFELIKLLRRGQVSVVVAAGYDETYFGAQNLGYNVYYRGGVSGEYEIVRRVTIDAYGSYRNEEYPDALDREDDIYRAGGGLTWAPLSWLSIRGGYSYRQLDSNFDENNYIENRGLLTITVQPDQPFILNR